MKHHPGAERRDNKCKYILIYTRGEAVFWIYVRCKRTYIQNISRWRSPRELFRIYHEGVSPSDICEKTATFRVYILYRSKRHRFRTNSSHVTLVQITWHAVISFKYSKIQLLSYLFRAHSLVISMRFIMYDTNFAVKLIKTTYWMVDGGILLPNGQVLYGKVLRYSLSFLNRPDRLV